ncbi:SIMPL domain-containing protein [Fictibacillus phosphorivorans]|uniref:SIMPL domain-containing protein n=1 Tax=Fictibacillus phosphorivorans TaxID=1221500 RepID=UPI00203AD692|nr:SIMPL domain-containing protein [Fictibacillus phosphorivorans]MCM3719915.1 SIMPL domain-containing protein [Fictibacillus phosphorivorans]MCM3777631.1 SIMPL domain-containing protein [Fictibacillus phosphorivorans]
MYYSYPSYQNMGFRQMNEESRPNRLTVTGEGSVSEVPDQAMITIGVITENMNLSTAQSENAAKTSSVIQSLMSSGIAQQDIQTSTYRIEPQYTYENGQQTFRGYRVEHQLQVTIKDIQKTGQIIDQAVANGANSVSSIQFSVTNPDAFYNQALTAAIHNAQQKAVAMAQALQVTLQPVPISVQELSQPLPPPPIPFQAATLAQGAGTPIQPGENKITATVKIEYTYR